MVFTSTSGGPTSPATTEAMTISQPAIYNLKAGCLP
jgi:hypothetical protein